MQIEHSNFIDADGEARAIPESAPDVVRTKIQAIRDRKRAIKATPVADPEGWELLKQFLTQ